MMFYGIIFDHESFEVGLNVEVFAAVGLPIAYTTAPILGVPTNLLLPKGKCASVRNYALVCAVVEVLFGILFLGFRRSIVEAPVRTAVYGGPVVIPGATVVAVFGAIAGKGRPIPGVEDAT